MPKGAVLAAALLVGAEGMARALLARGTLAPDPSLRTTLEGRITDIRRTHPPVWFVGNSTLDWGIDQAKVEKALGEKVVKLSHGSATLRASAAMLQFYIDNAHDKPERVVVTLTKDDLNANGSRAEFSTTYADLAKTDKLPDTDWLALRRVRGNLRDAAVNVVRPGYASKKPEKVKQYDGHPLPADDTFNYNLLKNYALDTQGFADLAAVCKRNGLPPAVVVLMPVTDQYGQFHDRMVPSPKYAEVHEQVVAAVAANGMPCLDYWATPRTDYANFRDAYHLSPGGEAAFTARFAADVGPLLATTAPRP